MTAGSGSEEVPHQLGRRVEATELADDRLEEGTVEMERLVAARDDEGQNDDCDGQAYDWKIDLSHGRAGGPDGSDGGGPCLCGDFCRSFSCPFYLDSYCSWCYR